MSNSDIMGPGSPINSSGHSFEVHSRQSRQSRSNSYQYSDSFDSEDSGQDTRQVTPAARRNRRGQEASLTNGRTPRKKSYSSASANVGKPAKKKTGPRKGIGTKSVGNSSSRNMSLASTQASPRSTNDVHQRLLSAKGHTISRLRNELEELKLKYEEALGKNRLMKQVQRRHERALSKFQGDEAELPQLMKKHSTELDSLHRRIRSYQQRDKDQGRRAKEQHEQLLQARDDLRRLQGLVADRGLKDRDHLRRRADQLEGEMEEKNSRISELERYIENMKKNHRHTEHQWRVKELDIKNRLREAETERDQLKYRLREREKELDVRNIYSNRFTKAGPRFRTLSQSNPLSLSVAKSISADDLRETPSPRSEVKQMSEVKQSLPEDERPPQTGSFRPSDETDGQEKDHQQGEIDRKPPGKKVENSLPSKPVQSENREVTVDQSKSEDKQSGGHKQTDQDSTLEESPRRGGLQRKDTFDKEKVGDGAEGGEDEHLRILRMLDADVQNLELKKAVPTAKNPAKAEQGGKVFGSTDNGTYKPTWLFGNKPEEKSSEESGTTDHLRKEPAGSKDMPDGGGETFPFFGSTQPAAKQTSAPGGKPAGGVVNSVRDLYKYSRPEETKKNGIVFNSEWKSEVEGGSPQRKPAPPEKDEYQRKKEQLLQRMKETDNEEAPPLEDRTGSGKSTREYSFTRPVENLHHGRPSHPEVNLSPKHGRRNQQAQGPRKDSIDVEEIAFGSYTPSFSKQEAGGPVKNKPKQGHQDVNGRLAEPKEEKTGRGSFGGGSVFSTSTKAKPVSDGGGLPWETNTRTTSQGRAAPSGNGKQGTLFATMPYSQQNGPFAAKPITTAADDLDDDLEEFVL